MVGHSTAAPGCVAADGTAARRPTCMDASVGGCRPSSAAVCNQTFHMVSTDTMFLQEYQKNHSIDVSCTTTLNQHSIVSIKILCYQTHGLVFGSTHFPPSNLPAAICMQYTGMQLAIVAPCMIQLSAVVSELFIHNWLASS